MQTKTFSCASLDTDQDMKASFSCVTGWESKPGHVKSLQDQPSMAQKAQVGLRVLIRVQSCRQVFIFHACPALNPDQDMHIKFVFHRRPGPAQRPFACPSLNPDQDMQINFGFSRAPGPRSKTLCMSKSEPRPGHANQFWFSTGAPAPLKNPLHVPRPGQAPLKNPLHVQV